MMIALLALVLLAAGLVILSGIWVTVALIAAIWHVDRGVEGVSPWKPEEDARDTGKNSE